MRFWIRIASAWAHSDGRGFNLQIDVASLDGRITPSHRRIADKK